MSRLIDKILLEAKISLTEKILNIWPDDIQLRKKYGQEVYDLLQNSYSRLGGIKGNGFNSVDDMIKNITLWKLVKRGDKIVSCVMYKDRDGRKRVAAGTDGSDQGKHDYKNMVKSEIKFPRSYGEVSKAPLAIANRQFPNLEDYAMPYDEVAKLLPGEIRRPPADDEEVSKYPKLKDFFYQRQIGGHWHTKITVGQSKHSIKKY